jgi:hypothetical protein
LFSLLSRICCFGKRAQEKETLQPVQPYPHGKCEKYIAVWNIRVVIVTFKKELLIGYLFEF